MLTYCVIKPALVPLVNGDRKIIKNCNFFSVYCQTSTKQCRAIILFIFSQFFEVNYTQLTDEGEREREVGKGEKINYWVLCSVPG